MNDIQVRARHDFEEDQRSELMDAVLRRMREDGCEEASRNNWNMPQCICRCYKSGDRDIPNHWTEACEANECPCHGEDL
jgi:hypothetical protein